MLEQAGSHLREATRLAQPADRYALAHLAALRGAAAVLASRQPVDNRPPRRRARPVSAWVLLTAAAPELTEWAERFAAGAPKRAAAAAGVYSAVTDSEADTLVRDVRTFLSLVEATLGLIPGGATARSQ